MKELKDYPISTHDTPPYKVSYYLTREPNHPNTIRITKRTFIEERKFDDNIDLTIGDLAKINVALTKTGFLTDLYKCGYDDAIEDRYLTCRTCEYRLKCYGDVQIADYCPLTKLNPKP